MSVKQLIAERHTTAQKVSGRHLFLFVLSRNHHHRTVAHIINILSSTQVVTTKKVVNHTIEKCLQLINVLSIIGNVCQSVGRKIVFLFGLKVLENNMAIS